MIYGEQWECPCGTPNFFLRKRCRDCGKPRTRTERQKKAEPSYGVQGSLIWDELDSRVQFASDFVLRKNLVGTAERFLIEKLQGIHPDWQPEDMREHVRSWLKNSIDVIEE